jgi:hypothetical protein
MSEHPPTDTAEKLRPLSDALDTVRQSLTWQLVRGVGELQFLTRASYAMLAVVPLLASTWQSVRLLINGHDAVLEHITKHLADVSDELNRQVRALASEYQNLNSSSLITQQANNSANKAIGQLASSIQSMSNTVDTELAQLHQFGILSPWLPASWTWHFLLPFLSRLDISYTKHRLPI